MWQFWLIAAGIFLVIEILTTGFLVFWLSIGALITMIVSFFTDNVIIQGTVFLISSTLLIIATKPLVRKFFNTKNTTTTNTYSVIGKQGIVTKEIDSTKNLGQVKIDGEIWSAKSNSDTIIPKDTKVEVIKIDGVKAVVGITSNISTSNN